MQVNGLWIDFLGNHRNDRVPLAFLGKARGCLFIDIRSYLLTVTAWQNEESLIKLVAFPIPCMVNQLKTLKKCNEQLHVK